MTGILGPNAQFIPVEDWLYMTPMTPNRMGSALGGRKYAVIRGEVANYPAEFYIGEQHSTRKRKDSPREETPSYYLMASFTLPFWVKNVNVTPSKSLTGGGVKLEGDFNEFFTVHTAKGQEDAAFQILPPDTMMHLLEKIPNVYLEYYQNRLIIKVPIGSTSRPVNSQRPVSIDQTSAQFFELVEAIIYSIDELGDSAKTGRTEPEGYKTITNGSWKVLVGAAIVFAALIYGFNFDGGAFAHLLIGGIFVFLFGSMVWSFIAAKKRQELLKERYGNKTKS